MTTGKVKSFNEAKGYGFIEVHGGGDIFVHYTDIQIAGYRSPAEGDTVTFGIMDGEKGPRAANVMKAE